MKIMKFKSKKTQIKCNPTNLNDELILEQNSNRI